MSAIEIEKDEKEFEEYLNEIYGDVEICGMYFEQGTALKELDPTAFYVFLSDEPTQWECSYCFSVFDSEEEAEECCGDVEEEEEEEEEED